MPFLSHIIKERQDSPLRLDRYVSEKLCILSRSQIKTRALRADINGKNVKLSRYVKYGDLLELRWDESPPLNLIPQNIPLDIIYEDERCVVVNKPQGMVVHPGAGNKQGTLANALCFRQRNNTAVDAANVDKTTVDDKIPEAVNKLNDSLRPGIVHRLDKDTSGIIIAAYDEEALVFLSGQFKSRKVKKYYIAVTCGNPEARGRIETFIARDSNNRKRFTVLESGSNAANGKLAVTFFKVIKSWDNYSLVLLRPRTGRTHQLRVHMRHLGCPILGDPVYGKADKNFPQAGLMLHSKKLVVTLPGEAKEKIFSSQMPERFTDLINKLDRMSAND